MKNLILKINLLLMNLIMPLLIYAADADVYDEILNKIKPIQPGLGKITMFIIGVVAIIVIVWVIFEAFKLFNGRQTLFEFLGTVVKVIVVGSVIVAVSILFSKITGSVNL